MLAAGSGLAERSGEMTRLRWQKGTRVAFLQRPTAHGRMPVASDMARASRYRTMTLALY